MQNLTFSVEVVEVTSLACPGHHIKFTSNLRLFRDLQILSVQGYSNGFLMEIRI